ncbi:MgtC/SapB family protein [Paenibacillus sepulcri]
MELDYLLRVVIAGACGAIIGYERKSRMKEAGIRTHFIVAVGAALMMVVSKYGFQDQLNWDNLSLDPARIAAQVVSGIGFLGAGMIFMQKQTVKGLTTAAGVWATSGIGLTIGAGLYTVGVGVTLLIFIGQKLLHLKLSWLRSPRTEQVFIRADNETGMLDLILQEIEKQGIRIAGFHVVKNEAAEIEIDIQMILPPSFQINQLILVIQNLPAVRTIDYQ